MRRSTRYLWGGIGAILFTVALKFFVGDIYRIQSGSMRPTLFDAVDGCPGERVLVLYDRAPRVARFDLVVREVAAGEEPVVKRVVGLPNEKIRIEWGDLFINGKRLGPDAPRPAPIPVFDDRLLSVEEHFNYKPDGPWRQENGVWILTDEDIEAGSNQGMMLFHPDLGDDYIDPRGRRVTGSRQVNDAILECEFALDAVEVEKLRFLLVEEGDTFEVRFTSHPHDPEGWYVMQLVHRSASSLQASNPVRRETPLDAASVRLDPERWVRLRFENVDNHVRVELPDAGVELLHSYERNEPQPGAAQMGKKSFGPRVGFGGEGCHVRFRSIRVLRDLYYTPAGTHAVGTDLVLGPDEVFLLGDNSATSRDSRYYGPIPTGQLLGTPVSVCWPFSRFRTLEGARPRSGGRKKAPRPSHPDRPEPGR